MRQILISIVAIAAIVFTSCGTKSGKQAQKEQGSEITFVEDNANKKIDVMIDGEFFTSYRWPDNVCKPILYPILASSGTEITRGFPIDPRKGERVDHPHQTGMWLTYGNVDGNDFWGNGSGGLGTINAHGGIIKHIEVESISEEEGTIVSNETWLDSTGIELLKEHTKYHFIDQGSSRLIDRITTLTAGGQDVAMPDTKEGMFGIRVARWLELPSEGSVTLFDANGQATKVEEMANEGISGNYLSSEGTTGLEVWGTRARWMNLYGNVGEEKISLVICDHPKNINYPTYWHARGYGLFSANPFGVKDFTEGKEELNYSIPAGESISFRYRVILNSGTHLTDAEINAFADDFAGKY